jgi:hypothetical protein
LTISVKIHGFKEVQNINFFNIHPIIFNSFIKLISIKCPRVIVIEDLELPA